METPELDADRRRRWEKRMEWPLTLTAVVFLAAYAWEVLADLHGRAHDLAEAVITVTWVVFALDYGVRLALADRRVLWFTRHLPDLAVVALPMLRPLRLLRLVNLLSILHRSAGATLRGRVVLYVVGSTGVLIGVSGLAILEAERHARGSGITTYGDALWWAISTITTVGYGDTHPVTTTGRFIAAGLMIAGIALLGVVTATLASWLVQQVADRDEDAQAATRRQVAELSAQVAQLHAVIERFAAAAGPAQDGGSSSSDRTSRAGLPT